MAKLAFDQLFRNGKPYMKRDDVLIDRIANGKLFELSDGRGYLKVFDIVVRFQDGSESKYKSSDLNNESVARILKAEMDIVFSFFVVLLVYNFRTKYFDGCLYSNGLITS